MYVSAGALRAIVDILQTLGGATLATTTVVLGASMFPQTKTSQTVDQQVTSGKQCPPPPPSPPPLWGPTLPFARVIVLDSLPRRDVCFVI